MTDTKHANIFAALAAAQAQMQPPEKNAENPAFKREGKALKYADLSSVVESIRKPLTDHGIAWGWRQVMLGEQLAWECWLHHGATSTETACAVPLYVDRNNMHGLKSAITYAKRIGLESVSGQAPADDDDGNLAAEAAPKPVQRQAPAAPPPETISADQFVALRDKAEQAGVPEDAICAKAGVESLHMLPVSKFDATMKKLQVTIDAKKPADDLAGDAIPY
jgi:hypothetical protein